MLSDNIRKYRKLNNMSQDELAEKLEVTRQSISLWETGQTQPSLENIVALAKLFNVSTDELLVADRTEPSAPSTSIAPKQQEPKKKTKVLFLVLCVAFVLALATVALVLSGGNSKNDVDPNNAQSTTTTIPTINNTPATEPEQTENNTPVTEPEQTENNTPVTEPKVTESNTPVTEPEETEKDIFGYLKNFVIQNGTVNGDYCYFAKSADHYGGYASESFSLYYWGDTNKIEFCLHSVINDTFSINFYLYVPEKHSGSYEYISSYYYRDTGEALYEAKGTIQAQEFTDNYPLNCTKYFGSTDEQNVFMEISRQGICDLISCIRNFIKEENIKYSFEEFGFLKF